MNYIHDDSPFIPASNSDNGITIRTYIAAQVLPQLIVLMPNIMHDQEKYKYAAKHAVLYADALITELNKNA